MASLGEQLRTAREAAALTIEEAAVITHIPREHLAAMESDNLATLPGPPFNAGFIRIYAEALQLPVQPLLDVYYAQAGETPSMVGVSPIGAARRGRLLVLASLLLTVALGAVLVILLFSIFGGGADDGGTTNGTDAAEPTIIDRGAVFELVVVRETRVRIEVDGRALVDETLASGESRQWSLERETILDIGAADAVTLTIDGETVEPLADPGQPAQHTWRVDLSAAPAAPRPRSS